MGIPSETRAGRGFAGTDVPFSSVHVYTTGLVPRRVDVNTVTSLLTCPASKNSLNSHGTSHRKGTLALRRDSLFFIYYYQFFCGRKLVVHKMGKVSRTGSNVRHRPPTSSNTRRRGTNDEKVMGSS